MKTSDYRFIAFRNASTLSDIACPDGELLDADIFFPDDDPKNGNDPGDGYTNANVSVRIPSPGETIAAVAAGFHLLGSHRISATRTHIIASDSTGALSYLPLSSPAGGWRKIEVAASDRPKATDSYIPALSLVATVGPWLVLLPQSGGRPLYALWKESLQTYSCAATMAENRPQFSTAPAALAGFCNVAGDFPKVRLRIDCPDSLREAVRGWLDASAPADASFYEPAFEALRREIAAHLKEAWAGFLANAEAAGLIVLPRYAGVALRYPSSEPRRQILAPSEPRLMGGALNADASGAADNLHARIAEFSFSSATLLLTVEFSCRPQRLSVTTGSDIRPDFLKMLPEGEALPFLMLSEPIDIIDLTQAFSELRSLPESAEGEPRGRGWTLHSRPAVEIRRLLRPADSYSLRWQDSLQWDATTPCDLKGTQNALSLDMTQYRNIAAKGGIAFNSRLVLFGEGKIQTYLPDMPISPASPEEFEGGEILALHASYRSLSSGEFGQFPIYAFCPDGIRALSPSGQGFRSIQLICRDVPKEPVLPVATTTGVAFFSTRGPLILEGSKATPVAGYDDFIGKIYPGTPPPEVDALAWHYASDSLIVFFADGMTAAYSVASKRWTAIDISAASFVEAWPELYIVSEGMLSKVRQSVWREKVEEESGDSNANRSEQRLSEEGVRQIVSRPFKLGDAMAMKKIATAELTPDGSLAGPWRLEASNDLRHWHPLASTAGRRMPRLRGSAWRYYRLVLTIETALPSGIRVTLRS